MTVSPNGKRIGRPPTCTCGECKKCKWAAYMRDWYRRQSPDARRARLARRDKSLERARDRARYRRHRRRRLATIEARDPVKRAANKAVHRAVAAGALERAAFCQDCGVAGKRLSAHHEDYSKPLDIVWLCYPCHGKRHRKPDDKLVTANSEPF